MTDPETEEAFGLLLRALPECRCDVGALCRGAGYFSVPADAIARAARELPKNHRLSYAGVRLLLSACLEEFADIFREDGRRRCEVTVPAPPFALYAFQEACPDVRFACGAFFAQIVLRGILLDREPLSFSSCAMRHCGLNQMRVRLLREPPTGRYAYQLQFGVLCDGCVKTGERAPEDTKTLSVTFPQARRSGRRAAEDFYGRMSEELGASPGCGEMRRAFLLYGRLMRAENRIAELCARPDREPLWGNSLSLAQSVSLFTSDRTERFIQALELLARELEDAPPRVNARRMYCYYIPFLQPGIDRRFRENGVDLVGNAAFLQSERRLGLDLPGMTEAWLDSMANRASPEKQCAAIAEAVTAYGCESYLTGFFGFDRRLGAGMPLKRAILKDRYGITTKVLDTDFWCENAMFGSPEDRIDQLCC